MTKLLLFSCSLILLFSCNNNQLEPLPISNNTDSPISIEEAKSWYNTKNLRQRASGEKTPVWEDAIQKTFSDTESYVVLPIINKRNVSVKITNNRQDRAKNKADEFYTADIITQLLILKTKSNIETFEMRIVADNNYYSKNNKTKINSKDFDGYVYFFDAYDKLKFGQIYENGKQKGLFGNLAKKAKVKEYIQLCTQWLVCGTSPAYPENGSDCYTDNTCETIYVQDSGGSGSQPLYMDILGTVSGGTSLNSIDKMLMIPKISAHWSGLNNTERAYFREKWWLLPGAAASWAVAEESVWAIYCGGESSSNDNAFKHALWAAMLCTNVGPREALTITGNHEAEGSYEPDLTMDLHNNNLGINTYKSNSSIINSTMAINPLAGIIVVRNLIINKIDNGLGLIRLPNTISSPVPSNSLGKCF